MSDLLTGLLLLSVGGSVAPPLLLLTILFLGSQRPLPNAGALVLGYLTVCAVVGVLGLVLFGDAGNAISVVGRVISVAVGVLLLVLGLGSLLGSSGTDASPPGWLASIDNSSPLRAFSLGMALFPLQVKNLAIFVVCLNLIIAADLETELSILALALVLLVFALPVLALMGLYVAVPQRASSLLASLQVWMVKHGRTITVVICLVFGAFFLLRGLLGA